MDQDGAARTLELFGSISEVPRPSGGEERISRWLTAWAAACGFDARRDSAGNVLAVVPATPGRAHLPTVVLQSHMDMVCEKTPAAHHDFTRDPIRPVVEGEWLRAEGTSLGADNGIGMALAMDLASDPAVAHGPLELLFTVDEESGLTGAMALAPGFISGRVLINLDSEEEGVFTVGCAGGRKTRMALRLPLAAPQGDERALRLEVAGLRGGHSGIDIAAGRACAVKIAARALARCQTIAPLRLAAFQGGTAHNAIAREAQALFTCPAEGRAPLGAALAEQTRELQREFAASEGQVRIALAEAAPPGGPLPTREGTAQAIRLLLALPHGVAETLPAPPGTVRTSSNLARASLQGERLEILTSQRSLSPSQLGEICGRVEAVAALAGAEWETDGGYPPWEPLPGSDLLQRCLRVHEATCGRAARVEVLHAGLECAVIGSLYPGIEMVSCGPTMKHPHSPEERLHIPSVARLRRFLAHLLASWEERP